MNRGFYICVALASPILASLAACATPAPKAPETPLKVVNPDASIPFVGFGAIRSWNVRDDGSLVMTSETGRTYRATFMGACPELKFAGPTLALKTGPVDRADRFSSIIVNGRTCNFATLDEVIDPKSQAKAAPSGAVQGQALPPPSAPPPKP
jgi:hypothetical protein